MNGLSLLKTRNIVIGTILAFMLEFFFVYASTVAKNENESTSDLKDTINHNGHSWENIGMHLGERWENGRFRGVT